MNKIFAIKRASLLSLLLIFLLSPAAIFAARVDSVMVYSQSMNKEIDCRVVVPDNYTQKVDMPVVYLLHGYGGNSKVWIDKYDTRELADKYSIIIVSVDGGFSSWYWDSPVDSSMKYETFVSKELIEYIDSSYSTIADKKGRAISGFSMGGHGALYLSIRHQDVFGAVGSMSGGVDIRPFPEKWDMAKRLGSIEENPKYWDEYTVMGQLDLLEPDSLQITFDCGVDDFFFEVNNTLHRELLERKIPHRYTTAPGAHTLSYWRGSLQYHMLFFDAFFKNN